MALTLFPCGPFAGTARFNVLPMTRLEPSSRARPCEHVMPHSRMVLNEYIKSCKYIENITPLSIVESVLHTRRASWRVIVKTQITAPANSKPAKVVQWPVAAHQCGLPLVRSAYLQVL